MWVERALRRVFTQRARERPLHPSCFYARN